MAVFEQTEDGDVPAFVRTLARAVGSFVVTGLIVGPLLIGALLGHFVTERLDDPEGMAIKANLPLLESKASGPMVRGTNG